MTTVKTVGTVLKRFQQDAIESGISVLSTCLIDLANVRGTKNYNENKKLIVGDLGALLLDAPTGTGKTLMAGHIAEKLSYQYKKDNVPRVLWFWFAPFAGLVVQSARTIRSEFDMLRAKDLATDRNLDDLKSGDVFVTTWSSVAVKNDISRKARTSTETMPSIDELVIYARAQGYVIGVVIDEAHHTFRRHTQAFTFYRDVLVPELTIMATATPRDKEVDIFTKAAGITNLRHIKVSRQQAVDARLIKEGVKVAVFKAPDDVKNLIDFKRTALRQGVEAHKRVKESLVKAGLSIVPLLLVQVESKEDSKEDSVEQVIEWLKEMGFKTEGNSNLIRSHTADEPDPYLSTIAADETVEVLVFKLAVALGFDAPRAFTLVSMRRSRDEDFGIQIVGRILRVDRRLQVIKNIPTLLNYGYVFLADHAGQVGLTNAAQRINAIKSELASVVSNIVVVPCEQDEPTVQITDKGQTALFYEQIRNKNGEAINESSFINKDTSADTVKQDKLWEDWGLTNIDAREGISVLNKNMSYKYPLNEKLGAPRIFRSAMLSLVDVDIISDIVGQFRFDGNALVVAQQSATNIVMEQIEIFKNYKERSLNIGADLAQKEIDAQAQQTLLKADDYDVINIQALHPALMQQFKKEVEYRCIGHIFDSEAKLQVGLHKILALRPAQLKKAISEAVVKYTITMDAAPLPNEISSYLELAPARLNLYQVFTEDLNTWERSFAEYLDNDLTGTVLWWHRNPVRQPFSVKVPLPGQPNFFPDFIVGINDRKSGNGILLIETKRDINDQERNALVKAQAEHPDYKKVMMLYWEEKREWMVVEYDSAKDKNVLDRILRAELMVTY